MKSNEEKKMGLSIGLVTGLMFGVELYDDDESSYFIMDLGILRLIFYKDYA